MSLHDQTIAVMVHHVCLYSSQQVNLVMVWADWLKVANTSDHFVRYSTNTMAYHFPGLVFGNCTISTSTLSNGSPTGSYVGVDGGMAF